MRARILSAVLLVLAASAPLPSQAIPRDRVPAPGQPVTHLLRTVEGSRFIGRLVPDTIASDSIRFEVNGGMFTVARSSIRDITPIAPSDLHDGEYWFHNPHATRLFFAPTGRTLGRGEGYYSNTYLFLNGGAVGVTDRVTLGGTMTVVPGGTAQVGYLTPKVGVYASDNVNVAVGALLGYNGFGDDTRERQFGILYSVASVGSPDVNATAGIGWGYQGDRLAKQPAVMVGGAARVSRRMALVTENYHVRTASESVTVLGYGLRFFGEKLSVDLAFLNTAKDAVFPGVPFVSFAVGF